MHIFFTAAWAGNPPAGQPEVRKISAAELPAFYREFDAASAQARVIALLSPT